MKESIKNLLKEIKKGEKIDFDFDVFYPTDEKHGHLSTNFALILAKIEKRNPREVAQEVIDKLEENPFFISRFKVEIAGPGFINFFIKQEALRDVLEEIFKAQEKYGTSQDLKNKKILVEYGQPNPFKSFHIGHLRNIIIGEAVAKILENAGAEVIRTNYQGDVGLHIAKCFYGIRNNPANPQELKEKIKYLSNCYVLGAKAFKESEKTKEEIYAINEQIFSMHKEIKEDWKKMRQWSLDSFEEIYKRLGVKFDRLFFESEVQEDGLKKCQEAEDKGILKRDDGCLIFDGKKYGLNIRVFINHLGLPTYEAKELGLAFREFTYFGNLDKAIHVVGNEQINFFKVTFLVEKLLDEKLFGDKQFHLPNGFVDAEGMKMSSREGNVILAEDVIDATKKEVLELMKKRGGEKINSQEEDRIAEAVAIGAVRYSFLKVGTQRNITFNPKESVKMEGQSGPYIMYSYVRSVSILAKVKAEIKSKAKKTSEEKSSKVTLNHAEEKLIYYLTKFPDLTKKATEDYQLASIAEYAYELANAFTSFYGSCPVLGEKNKDLLELRVKIVIAFKNTLGKCLDLLGIAKMERM